MWETQPLTTLRASKACRGENFTFTCIYFSSSPACCHFLPNYSCQHRVLKHCQSSVCERIAFTPILNQRQNYSSVCFNLTLLIEAGEKKKDSDMNDSRHSPNSFLLLTSLWTQFLFVSVVPRFALITFSKDLVSVFTLWFRSAFRWRDFGIYLVFSMLVAPNGSSVFFFLTHLYPVNWRHQSRPQANVCLNPPNGSFQSKVERKKW
jgi:hypothetical protein